MAKFYDDLALIDLVGPELCRFIISQIGCVCLLWLKYLFKCQSGLDLSVQENPNKSKR